MFHLGNPDRAKRVAHDLKTSAQAAGMPLSLAKSLELTARMLQYRDWHDLVTNHAGDTPSKDDAEVSPSMSESRRRHHVSVLIEAGFTPTAADTVVSSIRPTDRARKPVTEVSYGLTALPDTTSEAWGMATSRRDGICFLATTVPYHHSPAILRTIEEFISQGRHVAETMPKQGQIQFPSSIRSTMVKRGEEDIILVSERIASEGDIAELLSLAAPGKLVLTTMEASSVAHAAAIIGSISGKNRKVLRHMIRGILAESPLRTCASGADAIGYSGETHVSEAWLASNPDSVDMILDKGPTYGPRLRAPGQDVVCQWMPMPFSAMDLVAEGTTDLKEVRRVFGQDAIEFVLYLREKEAA